MVVSRSHLSHSLTLQSAPTRQGWKFVRMCEREAERCETRNKQSDKATVCVGQCAQYLCFLVFCLKQILRGCFDIQVTAGARLFYWISVWSNSVQMYNICTFRVNIRICFFLLFFYLCLSNSVLVALAKQHFAQLLLF